MSYGALYTEMLSEAKDTIHQEHVQQYYMLVLSMIQELVPPMIEAQLKQWREDIKIDIQTFLNGKAVDISGIKQEIVNQLFQSL